jgi:hypothetical protein
MIITIYRPDGTKERRPIGYTGGACDEATKPYEEAEGGKVTKVATGDACRTETKVKERPYAN